MLYALHEMRHAWLAPWTSVAAAQRDLLTNPFSPLAYLPASRRIAAGLDLFYRVTRRYEKPEFGLATTVIDAREVTVEERVAIEKPFCRLLHFRRDAVRSDPPVLLVAPLSGHFATLLRDTRSISPIGPTPSSCRSRTAPSISTTTSITYAISCASSGPRRT